MVWVAILADATGVGVALLRRDGHRLFIGGGLGDLLAVQNVPGSVFVDAHVAMTTVATESPSRLPAARAMPIATVGPAIRAGPPKVQRVPPGAARSQKTGVFAARYDSLRTYLLSENCPLG